jgi:hypothetical protein
MHRARLILLLEARQTWTSFSEKLFCNSVILIAEAGDFPRSVLPDCSAAARAWRTGRLGLRWGVRILEWSLKRKRPT